MLSAKNGVEALETFKQHKDAIAVAVLDLGLPQLGGWQAFQQMREIRPELKALIATGLISPEVEAEIAQEKLCGVLSKPYQLDDVLRKFRRRSMVTAGANNDQRIFGQVPSVKLGQPAHVGSKCHCHESVRLPHRNPGGRLRRSRTLSICIGSTNWGFAAGKANNSFAVMAIH